MCDFLGDRAGAEQIKQNTLEPCSRKVSVSEGNETVDDTRAHTCGIEVS